MASYNFDDAYSTDSFTDSDWEAICDHVGVDVTNSEDENVDKEKGNKDSFDGKTESNSEREKNLESNKKKENEEQNIQDEKENEEQNLQDGNESQPSDNIAELRRDMKDMRKTLKKGRVQLLNWEETNIEDLVQTYKDFKQDSKKIKKKFKALVFI